MHFYFVCHTIAHDKLDWVGDTRTMGRLCHPSSVFLLVYSFNACFHAFPQKEAVAAPSIS